MCQNNMPMTPFQMNFIWSSDPWLLEVIVAAASLDRYQNLVSDNSYVLGFVDVDVGQMPDPPGWTRFGVPLNLGNPPKSQFVWELISEVAQVALHNFSGTMVNEGDADVAFTVRDIDVGLNADEIRDAVRPALQSQASLLSERLLGDFSANNGAVDIYYRRGIDDVPYLFFVTAEDPRPVADYTYARPGSFSDAGLTNQISRVDISGSGDTTHEKLALMPGDTTVYVEDDAGTTFRLRISVPANDPTEIIIRSARRMR